MARSATVYTDGEIVMEKRNTWTGADDNRPSDTKTKCVRLDWHTDDAAHRCRGLYCVCGDLSGARARAVHVVVRLSG